MQASKSISVSFKSISRKKPEKKHLEVSKNEINKKTITRKVIKPEKITKIIVKNKKINKKNIHKEKVKKKNTLKDDLRLNDQLASLEKKSIKKNITDVPVIYNPHYRSAPKPPEYPRRAIRRNQQGTVIVRAHVTSLGQIEEIKLYESCGFPLLDKSALLAVNNWQFEPARRNGFAIDSWVQVPVKFALK